MTRQTATRHFAPVAFAAMCAVPLIFGDPGTLRANSSMQQLPPSDQVAACEAWRVHLDHTVDMMDRTGSLMPGEVQPLRLLITAMGRRCIGPEPVRISRLFVLLLDLLTDQQNQP